MKPSVAPTRAVVPEGSYEAIYGDMPAFGLAAAHGQVPLEQRGRYAKDRFAHRSQQAPTREIGIGVDVVHVPDCHQTDFRVIDEVSRDFLHDGGCA